MEALDAAVRSLAANNAIQTDYTKPPNPGSIESIKAFQSASGLTPDGIIGPITRAAIKVAEQGPTFKDVSGGDMPLVAATLRAALPGATLNINAGTGAN
ncbi:MAG: hypothetical protein CMB80_33220 [Flammeovirgaceae bacterium]|nr:hypothetical protein [Flammeovirgaceae bacterium]